MVEPAGRPSVSWRLRSGWRYMRAADGLYLFNDVRRIRVNASSCATCALTAIIEGEQSVEYVDGQLNHILDELCHRGVLLRGAATETAEVISPEHRAQSAYFEGIGLDPIAATEALAAASVLVLGLGGTGSVVLQHLAGGGIRTFVLVDFDNVDPSNLGRQFVHSRSAVGMSKLESARRYVADRSPDANVTVISRCVESGTDVADLLKRAGSVDVAAICIDTPPGRAFDLCAIELWRAGVPFIHGGVMMQTGVYGPLFSARHSSPHPAGFSLASEHARSLEACFSPYNTIVGAHMAAELLHHLIGGPADYQRRTFIDWFHSRYRKLPPVRPERS